MKKVILLLVTCFSLVAFEACNNEAKSKEDKELPASDIPAAVKSAFSAKYSTASDIKWEDAHEAGEETYKAKFTLNGKKMKAEFDAKGGFVKEEEDN
jgi:hypothetical protein